MNLRRGRPKYSSVARHLVLRHAQRLLRSRALDAADEKKNLPPIDVGQEQLYSFYVPGLEAGPHQIQALQTITIPPGPPNPPVESDHQFYVVAPRFVLPSDAVYSVYPPQGHGVEARILPHVVLSDPTLPWERVVTTDVPPDYANNRVPWLAVLVFTEDELQLAPNLLSGPNSLFSQTDGLKDGATQSSTMSINMLVTDLFKTLRTTTPAQYDPQVDGAKATTDVIFLPFQLFKNLFVKYGADGKPTPNQTGPDVQHHRYLAHLRHINTAGMAVAGTVDDDQAFGIIVSHRTGPLSTTKPTTVIAHLVSIEGVDTAAMAFASAKDFVAIVSLYSWQYTCLPPHSFNVPDAFEALGNTLDVLRPELDQADLAMLGKNGHIGDRLKRRAQDGYSLTKYRCQTGEITAAFTRSPFSARSVNFTTVPWPPLSTTGANLQILDQELGIMDLTYSAAWQLGKTLALADQSFTAALSRVRKQIFDIAMNNAQADAIRAQAAMLGTRSRYKSRIEVVKSIAQTITALGTLSGQSLAQVPNGMLYRWYHEEPPALDIAYKGGQIDPVIDNYLQEAAFKVGSTADGDGPDILTPPYNEHNTPYSTDWMLVLKWVVDRYFLVDVPAHYLITDPSHLPLESLRFFTIDSYWVTAMIDGGLSLANHLDQNDDRVRNAIKAAINRYLETPMPGILYMPPIPKYGFYMHSALVTKFPDMIVDTIPSASVINPPLILRHEVVDSAVLFGLLSQAPSTPNFTSLLLRQPPHQQYFTAAENLSATTLEIEYQRVYTVASPDDPDRRKPADHFFQYMPTNSDTDHPGQLFIWGSSPGALDVRTLNMEIFATDLYTTLKAKLDVPPHTNWFTEVCPTAALMGIQLNEKIWQLEISLTGSIPLAGLGQGNASFALSVRPPNASTGPASNPTFTPPQIACGPFVTFANRQRSKPSIPRQVPPHFRIPRLYPPTPPTPPGKAPGSSSGPPVFTYLGYASTALKQPVVMTDYQQDLIFSIVLTSGAQQFQLQKMILHVPLSPPAPLIKNYIGAGATMLSNLRFNVIAKNTKDELQLTLIPRTLSGQVPLSKITEMSFILSGVTMQKYNGQTTIPVPVDEIYYDAPMFTNPMFFNLVPAPLP